ncbi:helix-turn-helix domain-containing protein [Micrococcus sp. FDAARGOS_333]|uniref:helix-turn-helix domain-containing protein n=1 Tax=Micrococcus sp. FDAARGOS_333 TaxID=1930558 RepID=UPI000B4E5C29|nr:helix-turn-helix domain-containing protein [Micrococcus sp. FDAARGOS_333]PNL17879.1 DNA-binding protein [Micrococcus sp. FDAARGOS_333]
MHAPSPALLPADYALYTRPEAAQAARATVSTVDRWIADGALPALRVGARRILIRRAHLHAYLAAHDTTRTPDPAEAAAPADLSALLTYDEAAAALRVSRTTMDRLQADGSLRMYRVGGRWKIPAEALAEYIDAHTTPATCGPLAVHPA